MKKYVIYNYSCDAKYRSVRQVNNNTVANNYNQSKLNNFNINNGKDNQLNKRK